MKRKVLILAVSFCVLLTVGLVAGCGSKAPGLTTLTPSNGAAGIDLALVGQSFGKTQGTGKVTVGGKTANIRSWTDSAIAIIVPKDLKAGDYPVIVTTSGGASNKLTFTVKPATPVTPKKPTTTPTTSPTTQPTSKNTPQDAISKNMQVNGLNISDYRLVGSKNSTSDPSWSIYDYQRFEAMGHQIFLLHKVNSLWTVITVQSDPFDATVYGAPADLTYP